MDIQAILLHLIQRLRHHTGPTLQAAQPGASATRIARALATILDLANAILARLAFDEGRATRAAAHAAKHAAKHTDSDEDPAERCDTAERLDGLDGLDWFRPRNKPLPILVASLVRQVAIVTPHLDPAAQAELQDLCNRLTLAADQPAAIPAPGPTCVPPPTAAVPPPPLAPHHTAPYPPHRLE